MSLAGSLGTSRGMRLWYLRKPKCRHCPKVNKKGEFVKPKVLFKNASADIGMCSGCFKRLTGERLSDQFSVYLREHPITCKQGEKPIAEIKPYHHYIDWLKAKIRSKQG